MDELSKAEAHPYSVPSTVRDSTRCSWDFVCLQGEGKCLCHVEQRLSDVHFISLATPPACRGHFSVSFGSGHLCSCPTRKELFNSYGV